MPSLTVARGTVKAHGKVFSQGESIRLPLRDIESIREVLELPTPYPKNNRHGQKRRNLYKGESLWKANITRLYFYKIKSLRKAMITQIDFSFKEVIKVSIEELIRMVVEKRKCLTAPSKT
jgi:hypothetical protein